MHPDTQIKVIYIPTISTDLSISLSLSRARTRAGAHDAGPQHHLLLLYEQALHNHHYTTNREETVYPLKTPQAGVGFRKKSSPPYLRLLLVD